jgi:rare lipoprotein A
VNGRRYYTRTSGRGYVERGVASWYGPDFDGKRTSTREVYDMYAMSAAHPTLPLPSYVSVTNLKDGRRVVVRVNDRGPFRADRVIDLSYTAAYKLGILGPGSGLVEVRGIDPGAPAEAPALAASSGSVPATGRPDLYVQVGAFGNRDNAARLQARLAGIASGAVRVSETRSHERPLYRVRVGPLADVDQADRLVARLADLGIDDHHIVVE